MAAKEAPQAGIVCIAFDFDGTLVDSNAIKHDAFFEVLRDKPDIRPFLEALLEHSYTETRHTIFAKIARHLSPGDARIADDLAMQYVQRYSAVTEQRVAESAEIPGAGAMLERLRAKGYTLALVSATPTVPLAAIIEKRGWRNKFSHVYGAPASKADNLNALSNALGIHPRQMVMVGDRTNDLQGADATACWFIGLLRPDSDFTATPRRAIRNLDELDAVIEQISAEMHTDPSDFN